MRAVASFLLAAVACATPAALASQAPPPPPAAQGCQDARSRQFDFWLGQWEVTNPAGKLAGHSRIESILGGCVLLENWESPSGVSGKSFNIYNADTANWEQFWVDNSGSRLHLSGGLQEGRMVLQGAQDKPNAQSGLRQHERITWTPNADGSVRQLWETSTDDGKTWTVSFDGLYRRANSP